MSSHHPSQDTPPFLSNRRSTLIGLFVGLLQLLRLVARVKPYVSTRARTSLFLKATEGGYMTALHAGVVPKAVM